MENKKSKIGFLKKMSLYELYNSNKLTVETLLKARRISLIHLKSELDKRNLILNVKRSTIVDDSLLQLILSTNSAFEKLNKKKTGSDKKVGNKLPKPKNPILRRNWLKRDAKLKENEIYPDAIIISVPMGGKVR